MSEASGSSPRAATGGPTSPARRLATAVVFGVCLFLSVALLFVDNGQSRVETYSYDERMLEGSSHRGAPPAPALRRMERAEEEALEEEEGFGRWLDGCDFLYLDVGTNIGVQIRKLYEPHLFPGARAIPVFDRVFGPDRVNSTSATGKSRLCAVGFEPNIAHTHRLKELEEAYRAVGWRVHIFTQTAVDKADGTADFFRDMSAEARHHEWGASLLSWQPRMQKDAQTRTLVRTVDLAAYLLTEVAKRRVSGDGERGPAVVMKLDIEGYEHTLLPHLAIRGALCSVDLIFAEMHGWGFLKYRKTRDDKVIAFLADYIQEQESSHDCPTRFMVLDDESFGDASFALPGPRTDEGGGQEDKAAR